MVSFGESTGRLKLRKKTRVRRLQVNKGRRIERTEPEGASTREKQEQGRKIHDRNGVKKRKESLKMI